ncbi:tetratricopeptide repeat protein [Candidatus Methanomethylophilus sp. 1R26]|uniref:tetratricopeptide repeat protein n=1 Tax=Candidatus Methanomethylophilus sp. 1R26 TaxID=1769296 RepID=UPI0009E7E6D6|nr:tetratricopeptide repeat protein [Candidatus Methanomethylophilus sp. 1R26]
MVLLGDVFSDGGSEQRSRSVELFREASRLGDASGTRNLAYCYAIGLNVAKDKAEAAKLYIAAGEMGNARAMCNIGVMYDYGNGVIQDRTAAFAWYVRSAQAGNKRGMTNLGEFYMLGKGTDRNLKLAAVWLERSGSPRALYRLAEIFLDTEAKDKKKGTAYLEASAKAGYTKAQARYARMIEETDRETAVKLYSEAASKGNADAPSGSRSWGSPSQT